VPLSRIVWLTTVGADLTPQPSPVWFHWDGATVLIYSQPGAPKIRNIGRHPRVSLSFNSTASGDDVVVLTGDAAADADAPPASAVPAYVAKYAEGLASLGMTAEAFGRDYSAAVRVRPTGVRGF